MTAGLGQAIAEAPPVEVAPPDPGRPPLPTWPPELTWPPEPTAVSEGTPPPSVFGSMGLVDPPAPPAGLPPEAASATPPEPLAPPRADVPPELIEPPCWRLPPEEFDPPLDDDMPPELMAPPPPLEPPVPVAMPPVPEFPPELPLEQACEAAQSAHTARILAVNFGRDRDMAFSICSAGRSREDGCLRWPRRGRGVGAAAVMNCGTSCFRTLAPQSARG
jgi:hypothetical protein